MLQDLDGLHKDFGFLLIAYFSAIIGLIALYTLFPQLFY